MEGSFQSDEIIVLYLQEQASRNRKWKKKSNLKYRKDSQIIRTFSSKFAALNRGNGLSATIFVSSFKQSDLIPKSKHVLYASESKFAKQTCLEILIDYHLLFGLKSKRLRFFLAACVKCFLTCLLIEV